MTEPWIAFPPEVHSAMLNYGAGVGPMLISATQNGELSAQYAEAASEVEELLGVVASEGWQGQAAEAFVAAYMPFLAWLIQASADCVEMAAQQHVVIEAYTAAVELMPTQVELAANQIKLAVLVATNFFGINTIPIAINEAEYVEMWVRAATTMATYSTVSRSALSAMPHTSPPPLILKSDELLPDTGEDSDEDGHNHGGHSHGGHARMIDNFFAEILRGVSAGRIVWDPVNGTLNGLDYDDYVYPGHAIWWLARGLEFFQDGEQFGELLFTNPTGAFQFLLYVVVVDLPTHIAQIATWLGQYPQLLSAALTGVIAHLGAITGFGGPIRPERHSVCCDTRRCTGADTRRGRAAYVGGRRGGPCSRRAGHAPRLSTRTGGSGRRHRSRPDAAGDWFRRLPALPGRRWRPRNRVRLGTVGPRQGRGVRFRCSRVGGPGLGACAGACCTAGPLGGEGTWPS